MTLPWLGRGYLSVLEKRVDFSLDDKDGDPTTAWWKSKEACSRSCIRNIASSLSLFCRDKDETNLRELTTDGLLKL
jgi:hypothetical protein